MKIIRKGNKKQENKYLCRCSKCNTIFLFSEEDVTSESTYQQEVWKHTNCPVCGEKASVHEDLAV